MNYTAEALDKVILETGVSYEKAKDALVRTEGDADAAIAILKSEEDGLDKNKKKLEELKQKLTDIIKSGNAKKIIVKRKGEEVVSVPLNLGIIVGIVGIAAAPVAVVIGAIAAYGFDCTIEVEKKDGTTEEVD